MDENIFYIYVHRKESDGSIFYVGKGRGERYIKHDNRNVHWRRTVAKHGFTAHKVLSGLSEPCAFSYERALISVIGRGNLVNMTDGGDGVSGYRFTAEQRAEIGRRVKESFTPEHRETLRQLRLGKRPANAGKPMPLETREKISAANKGRVVSDETRKRMSAAFTGRKKSEKERIAMSERMRGVKLSEETKQKLSDAMKGEKAFWYGKKFSEDHSRRISESKTGKGGRPVIRSDGLKFWSCKAAAEHMQESGWPKAASTGVTACCKGKQVTAYGFGWKYDGQ